MTVTFHTLWLVCLLGSATLAAAAARRPRALIGLAVGLVATAMLPANSLPDPEVVGVVAAGAAALHLFSPRRAWIAAVLGGALAGQSAGVMTLVGVPTPISAGVMAGLVAVTVYLTRTHADFAPDVLLEDALLLLTALGLTVAVLPSLLDGWQAAANLNIPGEAFARSVIPAWTWSIVVLSMVLGGVSALWSRR
jgi:hypothetical protein